MRIGGLAMTTSKKTSTRANKRQIEREDRERERANKTARVNWGERKTRGKWQIM